MTPDMSGAGRGVPTTRARHRASRKKQPILVRTIGVGGAAACIALVAELNAPDAEALSILLPAGNGNATQINILEGNVFDPQFGLGGNTSSNSTIGALMFGLGNNSKAGSTGAGLMGPIALGGATGNGNVTQIDILSYNIINPQLSLTGNNLSQNTTISNVAMNNGNGSDTTVTSGGTGIVGGAVGNGNTTQIAFLSGNIFNPQFSLFGSNVSNNTAIANVAAYNGNGSTTNVAGGGMFGTSMFGMTGNGNTTQVAGGTANIFNPQFTVFGTNQSTNVSDANQATGNGNNGDSSVGSTGGGLGDILAVGQTGNGNTSQTSYGAGNIYNNQWRVGLGSVLPPSTGNSDATLTNQQVSTPAPAANGQPGLTEAELLALEGQQQGTSTATGTTGTPSSLKDAVKKVTDAVGQTINRITQPKKPASTAGSN